MRKNLYRKYDLQDHRILAAWAMNCARRVLLFFEGCYPGDNRPRQAIAVGRKWVRTSVFKMDDIRGASLAAHAAARAAGSHEAACFAARAAGQAVASAHVAQHAYGAAYYALKAAAASNPGKAEVKTVREREWQSRHLPEHLRQEIMKRIMIKKNGKKISIKLQKGPGF